MLQTELEIALTKRITENLGELAVSAEFEKR
jgi:hypothetical protein